MAHPAASPLVIHGGTVIDPVTCREYRADLTIDGGIIRAVGRVPDGFVGAHANQVRRVASARVCVCVCMHICVQMHD